MNTSDPEKVREFFLIYTRDVVQSLRSLASQQCSFVSVAAGLSTILFLPPTQTLLRYSSLNSSVEKNFTESWKLLAR